MVLNFIFIKYSMIMSNWSSFFLQLSGRTDTTHDVTSSWKRYRLLVAATAMIFSCGCHAVCRIFLLKSRHSTVISSFFLLPVTATLLGFKTCFGLMDSRLASRHKSFFELRSNIWKKLLYDPVIIDLQAIEYKAVSSMQVQRACIEHFAYCETTTRWDYHNPINTFILLPF